MVLRLEFVKSVEKHSKIWKEVLIYEPRLQEKYKNEVIQAMMEKFGYKNIMEVPKLEKIVINMGVGEAKDNSKGFRMLQLADIQLNSRSKASLNKSKEISC